MHTIARLGDRHRISVKASWALVKSGADREHLTGYDNLDFSMLKRV